MAGQLENDQADRAYHWIMTAAILGSSIAFIEGSILSIALSSIRADLGSSLAQLQWIVNAYTLMLAAFILPGGAAGDAFGRKRVFMAGVGLFTLATLWCAVAQSSPQLIAARVVQGFGGALMIPASLALITTHVPRVRRGAAIGLWSAMSAAATAAGPILGGLLVDWGGWRPALLITVPVGLVTLAVAWLGVPGTRGGDRRMDWIGGALVCAGLGALAFWLTDLSATGPAGGAGRYWPAAVFGVTVLASFLWWQARASKPMMPLSLFRNPAFTAANLQTFLLYAALYGSLTYLPVVLIDAFGYPSARAGVAMLPMAVLIAVLSRLAGGLVDRIGARALLVLGPCITATGFAGLVWVARDGGLFTSVLPAMTLIGLGMGLTVAPISTTVMNAVPEAQAGTASGVNNAISRVSGLIGLPALGLLGQLGFRRAAGGGTFAEPASLTSGYGQAMTAGLTWIAWGCAALALASAATAWLWLRPNPQSTADPNVR